MAVSPKVPKKMSPYDVTEVNSVTFSVGTETGDAIVVTATLKDVSGAAIAKRAAVHWYVSGASSGAGVVGTAPTGGVTQGASGTVIPLVAGKAGLAACGTDGLIKFVFTDTDATTFYLVIVLPDGTTAVSGAITFVVPP